MATLGTPLPPYQPVDGDNLVMRQSHDADYAASAEPPGQSQSETQDIGRSGQYSYTPGGPVSSAPVVGATVQTSPGFLTAPAPIMQQPTSAPAAVFDTALMDAGSQLNYSAVRLFHRSGQAALESIHSAGAQALGMVDTTVAHLKDNITYEDLLQTLIHENERILTKDWRLLYRQATFFDCEMKPAAVMDTLPCGAAILTNKRLLLLSAQVHKGLGLTNNGDTKKTRSYTVVATNSDNVHYKPLPLKDFASIEMSASSGASVTTDVTPIFPCCRGLCICCGSCCESATKRWETSVSSTDNHNTRVLKIGLLLPPWGSRSMLHLDLDPQMPLSYARDFIAMLQQHPKLAV